MITLYYGSGSPYAWRVQLALEAKGLPYDRKVLSFATGDTRKPGVRRAEPAPPRADDRRRRLHALRVERDRRVPRRGVQGARRDAVPGRREEARDRAPADQRGRRLHDAAVDAVVERLLGVKPEERDAAKIEEARAAMAEEFAFMARYIAGDFLVGPLSAAGLRALSGDRVHVPLPAARADLRRRVADPCRADGVEAARRGAAVLRQDDPPHWRS
jgi:glutathione S-transferase